MKAYPDIGKFKWLSGDVNYLDYGGKWYEQIEGNKFFVYDLDPLEEDDNYQYSMSYYYIDLESISEETKKDITNFTSYDYSEMTFIEQLDALSSYGYGFQNRINGNNYRKLLRNKNY